MSNTFNSIAEQTAAPIFEALGFIRCDEFPSHLSSFVDSDGIEFRAKPDFYCPATNRYIEFKTKALNSRKSIQTATNRLLVQYNRRFWPVTAGSLTHDQLSSNLWERGCYQDCLNNAFNHSLYKHLIIQRTLGPEKYLVVFKDKLPEKDENNHHKKGLSFIYLENLEAFLTA